ncbi:MAG: hypothetical protein WBQ55_16940, partial [Xanthobacteraceae bacterium]
ATLRDRCAHLACTIGLEERSGFELTRLKLIARLKGCWVHSRSNPQLRLKARLVSNALFSVVAGADPH